MHMFTYTYEMNTLSNDLWTNVELDPKNATGN